MPLYKSMKKIDAAEMRIPRCEVWIAREDKVRNEVVYSKFGGHSQNFWGCTVSLLPTVGSQVSNWFIISCRDRVVCTVKNAPLFNEIFLKSLIRTTVNK